MHSNHCEYQDVQVLKVYGSDQTAEENSAMLTFKLVQAFAAWKPSAWFPYDSHEFTSYIYQINPPKYMQIEWVHYVDFCV